MRLKFLKIDTQAKALKTNYGKTFQEYPESYYDHLLNWGVKLHAFRAQALRDITITAVNDHRPNYNPSLNDEYDIYFKDLENVDCSKNNSILETLYPKFTDIATKDEYLKKNFRVLIDKVDGLDSLTSIPIREIIFTDDVKFNAPLEWSQAANTYSIVFPDEIDDLDSLLDNASVKEVFIPRNVTSKISGTTLGKCKLLSYVDVDKKHKVITKEFKDTMVVNKETSTLINYRGHFKKVEIPGDIKIIDSYAFADSDVEEVSIPSTVEIIGENAFFGCKCLKSIKIPEGVKVIKSSAFQGCSALKTLEIADSVTTIETSAFWRCDNVDLLKIGKNIGPESFNYLPADCNKVEISIENKYFESILNGTLVKSKEDYKSNQLDWNKNTLLKYYGRGRILQIPSDIVSINENAISEKPNLEIVEIPDSVKEIKTRAFQNCSSLRSVKLPSQLKSLGVNDTFKGCSNLRNIKIPTTISTIPFNCFSGCNQLETIQIDPNILYIEDQAFQDCKNLKSVIIMDRTQELEVNSSAFSNCTSLSTFDFSKNVKLIGASNFKNCKSLETVEISSACSSIPPFAFENCSNIKEIILPNVNIRLDLNCFEGCDLVSSIIYNGVADPSMWDIIQNYLFTSGHLSFQAVKFIDPSSNSKYKPDLISTMTISSIDDLNALNSNTLYDLRVVGSLFGDLSFREAFNRKTNIFSVSINSGITGNVEINNGNIKKLRIQSSASPNIDIGKMYSLEQLFCKNINIQNTNNGISNLEKINITAGKISDKAFYNCRKLKSVECYNDVTFGDGCFNGCPISIFKVQSTNITNTNSYLINKMGRLVSYFGKETNIVNFNPSIKLFGNYSLSNSKYLKSVILPNGIPLSRGLFQDCTELENVQLSNSTTEIPDDCFKNCKKLKRIIIPANVSKIGNNAFKGCVSLTEITFENVTSLGNFAFKDCKSLKTLNIASSIKSIGESCFENCTNIQILNLSEGLEDIQDRAFYNCTSLTNITTPTSLKNIGYSAFSECTQLSNVSVPSVNTIRGGAFNSCIKLQSITLPKTLTELSDTLFQDCTSLEVIDIPINVTKLGNSVFMNCKSLTNINLSDNTKFIGSNAFKGCQKLLNINLPTQVDFFGENIFEGCSSIKNISIPRNAKTLRGTFKGCKSLSTIKIPDGIFKVESQACAECDSLTDIEIGKDIIEIDSILNLLNIPSESERGTNNNGIPTKKRKNIKVSIATANPNIKSIYNQRGIIYYKKDASKEERTLFWYNDPESDFLEILNDEKITCVDLYALSTNLSKISLPATLVSLFGGSSMDLINYNGSKNDFYTLCKNKYGEEFLEASKLHIPTIKCLDGKAYFNSIKPTPWVEEPWPEDPWGGDPWSTFSLQDEQADPWLSDAWTMASF